MDLVSVIIPYYKKKKFIEETINSVLQQSYSKIEIIIIYDDENKEDLIFLKKKFEHVDLIKIIDNKKNIGAGFSRNIGIALAKGKYIGFIDADDIWKKDKISQQILFMKKNKYRISHTTYEIFDKNKNFFSIRFAKKFSTLKDILKSCDIGLSSVIIEKSLINDEIKFPNLKTKEDFVLWLKILDSGVEIGALNCNLMSWRRTKKSLSSSVLQKLLDGFRVYKNYMNYNSLKSLYLLCCLSINYLKKNV